MNEVTFWDDKKKSEAVISEFNSIKELVSGLSELKGKLDGDIDLLLELEKMNDEEIFRMLESDTENITIEVDKIEVLMLLNGPFDKNNCVLEVHSGAGGTEACDWAEMLYRMYTRFCDKKGYKYEVIDYQEGEEVGIKSVSILVSGTNAYGYLKHEKGIHRLVRLSPFDANNKRHTSFASIDITPEFDNSINIEINEKDLKIDVYRSSGAGGQSVNTTDSAVRITHLPTKTVVTCQNERSQIQNKERALLMLKNKLKLIEVEKQNAELVAVRGEQRNIEFGSQIRSYTLHPYSLIKDHRTNCESGNVGKILDGDLDGFIEASLKGDIHE